jgi:glucose-1-phosphate cytidylyltransferase
MIRVGILAGGLGSRLQEETETKPKPMVEIGGRPILWHIMKHYGHFGFKSFSVALGYKGEHIKRWMVEYSSLQHDITVDLATRQVATHEGEDAEREDWTVGLIDTGAQTMTGGRVKRLYPQMGDGTFMLTYGDGVSDVDLERLLAFHREHGRLATLTAVRPPARFGALELDGDEINSFAEKPQLGEGWINGGFYVFEPEVLDYIEGDGTFLEREPLEGLARDGQLMAYRHTSFWQCMDTLRDKLFLEDLWQSGEAPWRTWR